jgi:hypothetical protein
MKNPMLRKAIPIRATPRKYAIAPTFFQLIGGLGGTNV